MPRVLQMCSVHEGPNRGTLPRMSHPMCAGVGLIALLLTACPERRYPEHGTELIFAKVDGGREVFERRLAQLQVKARIAEDAQQLSVRLVDGVDVGRVKGLLTRTARLELCEEVLDDAKAWCAEKGTGSVSVDHEPTPELGCFFSGVSAAEVKKAAAGAKVSGRVLLQQADGRHRTFAVPKETCFSPHFLEGKWKRDDSLGMLTIMLTLDTPAARDFEKLTGRLVKQRLLIVLDGEVESAPVVMEPIPGGRIQVTAPKLSDEQAQVLTAALVGGPLEGVQLVEERSYGPPKL